MFLRRIALALVLRHLQRLYQFEASLPRHDNLIDKSLFGCPVRIGELLGILFHCLFFFFAG